MGEKKTMAKVSTGSEQQFSCENPSEKLFSLPRGILIRLEMKILSARRR